MTAKKTQVSKTAASKTSAKKAKAKKSASAEKPIKAAVAVKPPSKKAPAKKVSAKTVSTKTVSGKPVSTKSVSAKKSAVKKAGVKKAATKKATTKKIAATKAAVKPATKTTAVKKTVSKKAAAPKKAVPTKTAIKKVAAKKAVPKKPIAKKATAKKIVPRKAAAKKVSAAKSVNKAPVVETQTKPAARPETAKKKPSARKPAAAELPSAPKTTAVLTASAQKPVAPPRHRANADLPRAGAGVRVRQTVATRAPLPGAVPKPERTKATTIAKPIAGARNSRLVARPKSSRSPARGLSTGAVTALAAAPVKELKPRVLLDVPLSEEKLRQNIRISIFFLEAWLRSGGADSTPDLLELAGAAEAARAQIWRWLDQAAQFEDGQAIDAITFEVVLHREMLALREDLGEAVFNAGLFQTASELFVNLALAPDFHDFPDHMTTH